MSPPVDQPEFSDEQLRAALRAIGAEVRQVAIRNNLPLTVYQGGVVVELNPTTGKVVRVRKVKTSATAVKRS